LPGSFPGQGDGQPGLPAFQLEVARPFFALPASKGFLLAGGAALLEHLTARPTEDLDFFTAPERLPWRAAEPATSRRVTIGVSATPRREVTTLLQEPGAAR
jgi:hypothetical protein